MFKNKKLKNHILQFFVLSSLVRRFLLSIESLHPTSIIPALTSFLGFSLEFLHLKWYLHASFPSFILASILRLDCGRLLNINSWSKLRNANCSLRCLSAILFPLVSREACEFNTCVFRVLWAFPTNEKVWKLADSTRVLSSQTRWTVKRAFLQKDASFYFNLKSFSCQVQQKVFLTLVSDVFLHLSFDLPVLSPVFSYLNELDRSPSITLWYSFICLEVSTFLFADTCSLQSKANCMALKSTTSAKSLHDKQIKQTLTSGFDFETAPWKYCICVVL